MYKFFSKFSSSMLIFQLKGLLLSLIVFKTSGKFVHLYMYQVLRIFHNFSDYFINFHTTNLYICITVEKQLIKKPFFLR